MRGTEEKGIDAHIVTDLVSLAWSDGYDVGILVSADKDFVPAANLLQSRGIKIIHGAFPPNGSHLTKQCWGSIDVGKLMPSSNANLIAFMAAENARITFKSRRRRSETDEFGD